MLILGHDYTAIHLGLLEKLKKSDLLPEIPEINRDELDHDQLPFWHNMDDDAWSDYSTSNMGDDACSDSMSTALSNNDPTNDLDSSKDNKGGCV